MSTQNRASTTNGASNPPSEHSYFEQQRDILMTGIEQSLELVLQNINKLNRSIEEVISVGNEFSPVEALWSQFENVMAKDPAENDDAGEGVPEGEGETEVTEHQK
ncbi:DASH complex subunit Dad1 [Melanomma pulvis-pyrius CBS 109.77]|uniref:DASH complex subunit DAD1 n=1 Tax=Melanomma pulvis-pyrius CBS 109.77 TaxID=1314802 RepID=A0A6A6XBW4_9PLEO|nr:DASH complex subunit Dad1 [Melanomma pulvis-pyrius CBS 109.77]